MDDRNPLVSEWNIPYKPAEVSEASKTVRASFSERAARDAIRAKRIAHVQIGTARYTSLGAIIDFVESCRVNPSHQPAQAMSA